MCTQAGQSLQFVQLMKKACEGFRLLKPSPKSGVDQESERKREIASLSEKNVNACGCLKLYLAFHGASA